MGKGLVDRRVLLGGAATAGVAAAAAAAAAQAPAPQPGSLKGRTVLITGSSSGFGRLTALHLAELGATVVASMRNLQGGRRPEAVSLLAEAKGKPGRVHVAEIDVTDARSVVAGTAEAVRLLGGTPDVLVSNAGIGLGGPIELHDDQALELQLQTNLVGGLRMARAVLPGMRARKSGLIIPVSSQLGRLVMPNIGAYCSSKFGLEAAFEAMAYELAPFGVEVTIVQPGGYPTRIWESGSRLFDAVLARNDAERRMAYGPHIALTQGDDDRSPQHRPQRRGAGDRSPDRPAGGPAAAPPARAPQHRRFRRGQRGARGHPGPGAGLGALHGLAQGGDQLNTLALRRMRDLRGRGCGG